MNKLLTWNSWRWYCRLPLKWAIFGLTLLAVCFPYPTRLARHLDHWRDLDALVDPDAPALGPLVDELRPLMTDDLTGKEALKRVERFVYQKVPYDWDWNTWGMADYLPTVDEVLSKGREDCDGQAVVAASLLRHFGYDARLVANFAHMWVKTSAGETMSPGKRKTVVSTDRGLRIRAEGLLDLPKSIAFGIAVFPWPRELVVLLVLWWLLLDHRVRWRARLLAMGLLIAGLFLMRGSSRDFRHGILWMQCMAVAVMLGGMTVMCLAARPTKENKMVGAERDAGAASL